MGDRTWHGNRKHSIIVIQYSVTFTRSDTYSSVRLQEGYVLFISHQILAVAHFFLAFINPDFPV